MITFELAEKIAAVAASVDKTWDPEKIEQILASQMNDGVGVELIESKALGAAGDPDALVEGSIRTWSSTVHDIKQQTRAKQAKSETPRRSQEEIETGINRKWDRDAAIAKRDTDPQWLADELATIEQMREQELAALRARLERSA